MCKDGGLNEKTWYIYTTGGKQFNLESFYRLNVGLIGLDEFFNTFLLIFYLFICIWGAKSTLVCLIKQKSYSNKRQENNCHFPPELVTFGFRWPHYTPPHSHRSLTRLPASVFQFLCLPLTVFPDQRSLYPTVPRMDVDNTMWNWRTRTARNWRQPSLSVLYQQCWLQCLILIFLFSLLHRACCWVI